MLTGAKTYGNHMVRLVLKKVKKVKWDEFAL